jgi:hypothetical protein
MERCSKMGRNDADKYDRKYAGKYAWNSEDNKDVLKCGKQHALALDM